MVVSSRAGAYLCDLSQEDEKYESELAAESFTTKTKDGFLYLPMNH